jgi:hypothetical protein
MVETISRPCYSLDRGDVEFIRVPSRSELIATLHDTCTITDEIAAALHRAIARDRSPEEMDSIYTALLALHFILETDQVSGLEHFISVFDLDSKNVNDPPLRSFSTRQEADVWLKSHPRPPAGVRVEISGQPFSLGYDRESNLRVWARIPSLEELGLTEPTDEPTG